MSKISTAYDYYITQLETLFPIKNRIPNPYSLQDNSVNMLRDSWGLRLGGHDLISTDFKTISQQYAFIAVFCREVKRLDHDLTQFDAEVKAVNEDVFTLREFFYDVDNMNDTIDQINLGATSPVEFFINGKNNFLFVETTILTSIRETY